ncbi:MAG: DUF4350 domain-containing protein [Candidatus Pristimantibacillus sp.]
MFKGNGQRIGLAASIVAFILIGLVIIKPAVPIKPPYTSNSASPDGVKGIYTLLKEQGVSVKEWRKEWRFLPEAGHQAMVIIQPQELEEHELVEIEDWVHAGNDVLLLDSDPWQWVDFELEEVVTTSTTQPSSISILDRNSNQLEGTELTGDVDSEFRLALSEEIEPLLEDELGIIAGRVWLGEGSITLLLMPEWLRNDQILKHSHFELLRPYLPVQANALWFDDYHQGIKEKPGLLAFYPTWLLAILLQLAIGTLMWIWFKAVRFGPAYTPRAWTVRRGDETLLAAAGWYERRKLTRDAIMHQSQYVRSLMREHWGVPLEANDTQVLAAAKLHCSKEDVTRLAAVLQSWKEAEIADVYPVKQFVKDSKHADMIIRTIEKE